MEGRVSYRGLGQQGPPSGEAARVLQAGLAARSPEGTAAKGMQIKGKEDLWVEIQANTFRNWVNEHVKPLNMKVTDLSTDLQSGTILCALVEQLQGRPLKPAPHRRPASTHHCLENVTAALAAIEADGVKLVNIGNVDIVNGNLKLILGLIWSLIVRYQIGRSKFPPRKLMLAWLQAVLPECRVGNLTTDWNSGVLLTALLDYCKPGLAPHWRQLNPNDSIDNCRWAMEKAQREFGVPMVLEPEYLASPWLDELSGMTYLSYFMKPDSPGFHATLRWVNSRLQRPVANFTSDWNDGHATCEVIRGLGGSAPAPERLRTEPQHWEHNHQQAIEAGRKLGVEPILSARDMSSREVEHLGVMAYAAHFQWVKPRPPMSDLISVSLTSTSGRVEEPMNFRIDILSKELEYSQIKAYIVTPADQMHPVKLQDRGHGTFTPDKMGMHEIVLDVDDVRVDNRFFFRVLPRLVTVAPPGMAPCALGSLVEVLVNATGAPRREDIMVTAHSPSGRAMRCPLQTVDDTSSAIFQPDEPGTWEISITYQGKNIQGGPFTCDVFDPSGVEVSGLEGAVAHKAHYFLLDTSGCGPLHKGEVSVDIVHDKRSIMCAVEKLDTHSYRVSFMPKDNGKHRIYVYYNGYDVKGSPFMMRVGSHKSKSSKTRESPVRVSSPAGRYRESSPLNGSNLSQDYSKSNLSHDFNKSSLSQDYNKSNLSHDYAGKTSQDYNKSSHDYSKSSQEYNKASQDYNKSSLSTDYNKSNLSTDYNKSSLSTDYNKSNLSQDYNKSSLSTDYKLNVSQDYNKSGLSTDYNKSSLGQDYNKKISRDSTSRLDDSNVYKSSFNDSYELKNSSSFDTTDSSFVTRVTKSQDNITASKYRSESPRNITASPIGSRFLEPTRPDLHRTTSPIGRTVSPINRTGSPVYGGSRGVGRSSPSGGYSYNISNTIDTQSGVDHSSNMKVSAGRGPARRDSWDAIAKTRHLMSANSLESLANLTEQSLSTGLDHTRAEISPGRQDAETLRNTQLNRSTHYSRFADTSRDSFNRRLDELAGEEENSFTKNVSESRSQFVTSSAQQSFLSNRPPQTGGAGGHFETDATHNRFKSQLASSSPLEKGGAKSVIVKKIPNGVVGEPVEFEIDGSRAGSGNLEILVNGGRVTSAVRALGGQRFLASFTPHRTAIHTIQITFNEETVPGSPWEVQVMSGGGGGGGGGGGAVVGEGTRLVPAREPAVFEVLTTPGGGTFTKGEIGVTVVAPSKRLVPARVAEVAAQPGAFRIEFMPEEVGTHIIEVSIGGNKLTAGPLVAKVYDSSLIQVSDVSSGVVGQPCQFRVDASAAGEGQLEISINEGEVPNHVQVVGGGRCLVSFTPEHARPHYIDIKFNGETVRGCPFLCNIADTGRVTLNLSNLELIPVGTPSTFQLSVRGGGGAAELAVAVRGPRGELPVRVAGDAHAGLSADFTPDAVGPHTITVEYNGHPVQGTPFVAKAYDARLVSVGAVSGGSVAGGSGGAMMGGPAHFSVDASRAGEGNLEITISARGLNIPTQVHPQGNARFSVSFVPAEACDHIVNVSFNKKAVPGCPMVVSVLGGGGPGPQVALPPPGPVLQPAHLLITHPGGKLEDIEVNVEGPNGGSVPASVLEAGAGLFRAEFVPRAVGEHRLHVLLRSQPCPGSPFTAKVYDVNAIRVKDVASGTVGKPVTFLVETSQAGPGNLEVTVNGGRVPTSAQAQGQHTYAISFTPREPQTHTVDLRFNGQDVPGSPFQCQISSPARVVDVESLEKVSVGALCEFSVESPSAPTAEVLGPARRALPVTVSPSGPALYTVAFTPLDVGDHSVEVRLAAGGHVEGSPFLLKAYSAERVTVTDISPGVVGRPVGFTINASQAGAGNLEIIVAVGGRNVPNYVQSEGNARFKVNFKPVEAAPHSLSVRFNGRPVPGSPFTCIVSGATGAPGGASGAPVGTAPSTARVKGDGLRAAQRGHQAEVNLAGFGAAEAQVSITGPGGQTLPVTVTGGGAQGDWVARWAPEQVGRHLLTVQAAGAPLAGSPFTCNVYDVAKVRVTGLGAGGLEGMLEGLSLGEAARGEAGRPLTFSVDAASAGEGTLELVVSTAHSTVKAEVVACARGLYDVTFVPQSCEPHFVNITFNEAAVPGSPFQCDIQETVNHVQIGGTATVDLPTSAHTLEITDSTGDVVPHTVWAGLAEFGVGRVGRYTARATDPQGRPLYIKNINAFDSNKVRVISVGDAYCHRPAIITVSVADAGSGVLTAQVRCGGTAVPHSVRSSASRQELVYHPSRAAPHTVTLLYNGVPVSRRPLKPNVQPAAVGQEVTASGIGLYQARVGQVSSFSIDTLGRPARELDVVVSGPGGTALPVRCYQTKSGMLQAEFTVTQVGNCTIEVLHLSKPVSGSPFTCQAFNPNKVHLTNTPHGNVSVHTPICFTVNTAGAGLAELEVTATGPQGQGLAVEALPPSEGEGGQGSEGGHSVQLLPNTPGHYRIYCSYGGVSVPGSPLSVGVVSGRSGGTGASAGTLNAQGALGSSTRASGAGLTVAHVGKESVFTVISPHAQPNVQIEQVSGHEESWSEGAGQLLECAVAGLGRGEWRCSYIPLFVGLYEVRLSCPHQGPLPGSPWDLKVIDTSAVSVVGGWALQLETGGGGRLRVPAKLVFLTAGAGPGELQAMLGGRPAVVETVSDRSVVTLTPPEGSLSGAELPLELMYGGVAVAGAPRAAIVVGGAPGTVGAQGSGASERVLLAGRGLATAHVGETAHFTIDGSQAGNGAPEVVLQTRSLGRAVGVALTRAGPALWKAAYSAPQPGHYLLRVLWDNRLVKGCPLSVVVSGGADASLVTCSGVGLSQGVVGREIRSWIDTRRAGPGELTAHCTGPRKVAYCELYEHGDATFTLNVKPQEAGKHQLTVKYAGEHVPGSPFQLRVAGAPDASKVRVYGPGVEAGVLATFQSRFICDTRGAGAGQLTVRVRGPKGAFRVEMQRESQKDRTILCKFDPTEPGDYRVEVKWAGKLVPGSPFPVMIFDTQEELRRYMHNGQVPS